MASSLTLLLLLQMLWLINSYDDAYTDLRRRTSDLFRGTIVEMRDSIFLRNFEAFVPPDTAHRRNQAIFFSFDLDSLEKNATRKRHAQTEVVYKGLPSDSIGT